MLTRKSKGYQRFCSNTCAFKSQERNRKCSQSHLTKEYLQNFKNGCKKSLGVQFPAQSKEVQQKREQTCLQKYNKNSTLQLSIQNNKTISFDRSWNKILSWQKFVKPLFTRQQYNGFTNKQVYKWKCSLCGHEFQSRIYCTKHLY